jgi:hypothetical protein
VLGGAAAIGLGAHAVAQVATGRWGHGGSSEGHDEKKDGE